MRFSAATTAVVAVALVVVIGCTVERVRAGYWIQNPSPYDMPFTAVWFDIQRNVDPRPCWNTLYWCNRNTDDYGTPENCPQSNLATRDYSAECSYCATWRCQCDESYGHITWAGCAHGALHNWGCPSTHPWLGISGRACNYKKNCNNPSAPTNGKVSPTSGYETEDVAEYECNTGYKWWSGDLSRECTWPSPDTLSTGVFSGTQPTCVENVPPVLTSASVSPNYLKKNEAFYVTLEFNEAVTIFGNMGTVGSLGWASSCTSYNSDRKWVCQKTLVNENEGSCAFSFAGYDQWDNVGSTITSTTDGSWCVFDKTKPTISITGFSSNNVDNTRAKVGDVVSLSYTVSETAASETVTIHGVSRPNPAYSGGTYTATYTMTPTDAEGAVVGYVSVTDNAGNSRAITVPWTVTFDRTTPLATLVTLTTSNPYTNGGPWARVGDSVRVVITANEHIKQPTFTLGAGPNTVAFVSDTRVWSATRTMTNADATGTVAWSITWEDLAGNPGAYVTAATSDPHITFDKTYPYIGGVAIVSDSLFNSWKATAEDGVTFVFSESEIIEDVVVTLAGRSSPDVVQTQAGPNFEYTLDPMLNSYPEGNMAITVDFRDRAGNVATTVTTTSDGSFVNFDMTLPALTSVSISSNAGGAGDLAVPGSVITVAFVVAEPLHWLGTGYDVNATIATREAVVTGGPTSFEAKAVMRGTDVEGEIPFTIEYRDEAGLSGPRIVTTTDCSTVVFSLGGPVLDVVTIYSDHTNADRARVASVVTIDITASEDLDQPLVRIAGRDAAVAMGGDLTLWSASVTMAGGDSEGVIGFTINYNNTNGVSGGQYIATTDDTFVIFDDTAPGLSAMSISSDNAVPTHATTGDTVTLTVRADEGIEALVGSFGANVATPSPRFNDEATWDLAYTIGGGEVEGLLFPLAVTANDLAGNGSPTWASTTDGTSVAVDFTPPTLVLVNLASSNANDHLARDGDTLYLTVIGFEDLRQPTMTIGGRAADVTGGGDTWVGTVTVDAAAGWTEGVVAVSVAFADLAGIAGTPVSSTSDASLVTIDLTPPSFTLVSMVGNESGAYATVGDTLSVTITTDEDVNTPVVTINYKPAVLAMGADARTWTATLVTVVGDIEGDVTVFVDITDLAYNPAGRFGTTDGSAVFFETIVPVVTSMVTHSSNARADTLARPGDSIFFDIVANEPLKPPTTATLNGVAPVAVTNTDAGALLTWRIEFVVAALEPEGIPAVAISPYDLAGNLGAVVTASTDGSAVLVDVTPPQVLAVTAEVNMTRFLVLTAPVTLTFSEDLYATVFTAAGATVFLDANDTMADITVTSNDSPHFVAVDGWEWLDPRNLRVTWSTPLLNDETYTVAVGTSGYDLAGNAFGAAFTAELTTILPVVDSIEPGLGSIEGGKAVTIRGSNLGADDIDAVLIGGSPATSVVWVNETALTCVTGPVNATGPGGVVIHSRSHGTNDGHPTPVFQFNRAAVTSVTPASGPDTGGTRLVIRGIALGATAADVVAVWVSGYACVDIDYLDDTEVHCTTTGGVGTGFVNVESDSAGASFSNATFDFVYTGTPGPGAIGIYFNGDFFQDLVAQRIDAAIDFDWSAASPINGSIDADGFSVQWVGAVTVPINASYVFGAAASDGVRVIVNSVGVLEAWATPLPSPPPLLESEPIYLTAGAHDLGVHYYDQSGNASINLFIRGGGPKGVFNPLLGSYLTYPTFDPTPPAVLTHIGPNLDTLGGGTRVTIRGSGFGAQFGNVVLVTIAGVVCLDHLQISDTEITCTTQAVAAEVSGRVDVATLSGGPAVGDVIFSYRNLTYIPGNQGFGGYGAVADIQTALNTGFTKLLLGPGIFAPYPNLCNNMILGDGVEMVGSNSMAMGEELPWEDIYLESLEDSSSVFGRLNDMKKTRTIILCQIPSGFLRTGNDDPKRPFMLHDGNVTIRDITMVFTDSENQDLDMGGAIISKSDWEGHLRLENLEFLSPRAIDGGVAVALFGTDPDRSKLTVEGCSVAYGYAFEGGAIYGERVAYNGLNNLFTYQQVSSFGMFHHLENSVVRIHGSTFSESRSSTGGAVFIASDVEITGAVFRKNSARTAGAVYAEGGRLVVRNSTFASMSVQNAGGVYVDAVDEVTIADCYFNDSKSEVNGGAVMAFHSNVTVSDSYFSHHLMASSGTVYAENSTLHIYNSDFFTNVALSEGSSVAVVDSTAVIDGCDISWSFSFAGGACFGERSNLTVRNSHLHNLLSGVGAALTVRESNVVMAGTNLTDSSSSDQGLVRIAESSTLWMGDTVASGIQTDLDGGLLWLDSGSSATMDGVAISDSESLRGTLAYVKAGATLTLSNTVISDCAGRFGGAIYTYGAVSAVDSDFLRIAADQSGGAIQSEGNAAVIDLTRVTFVDNTAGLYGGAISVDAGTSGTWSQATFQSNSVEGAGGAVSLTGTGPVALTIDSSVFADNTAAVGGAASVGDGITAGLAFVNTTVVRNRARVDGGGIHATSLPGANAGVTFTGGVFESNTARYNGGAAYSQQQADWIFSSALRNNTATNSGGAVYTCDSQCGQSLGGAPALAGNTLSGNAADHGPDLASEGYRLEWSTVPGPNLTGGAFLLSPDLASTAATLWDLYEELVDTDRAGEAFEITVTFPAFLSGATQQLLGSGGEVSFPLVVVSVNRSVVAANGYTPVSARLNLTRLADPTVFLETDLVIYPCAPGYGQVLEESFVSCYKCPAGSYTDTLDVANTVSCQLCPPGTYTPLAGMTECIPCDPGNYQSEFGAKTCLPCLGGKFATSNGSSLCASCPPGAYAGTGESTCTLCAKGTYSSVSGTVECTLCPVGEYNIRVGQTGCEKCDTTRSECQGAVVTPHPGFQNFINNATGEITVGECPEGYCVDGLCAFEGHTGVLCAECETENNYYMWGGRCTLCETTTAWPILILCFMSLCLAAYFVFWQRASTGSSKIIIFFGQTMALLLNDMRRLPQANVSQSEESSKYWGVFSFSMDFLPNSCWGPFDFYTRFWLSFLSPLSILLFVVVWLLLDRFVLPRKWVVKVTAGKSIRSRASGAILQALLFFYTPVSQSILSAIPCQAPHVDSTERRLVADMNVVCVGDVENENYSTYRMMAIILCVVYVYAFPAYVAAFAYHVKRKLLSMGEDINDYRIEQRMAITAGMTVEALRLRLDQTVSSGSSSNGSASSAAIKATDGAGPGAVIKDGNGGYVHTAGHYRFRYEALYLPYGIFFWEAILQVRKVLILSILAFAANDDLRILLLAAVIALSMMANTVLKPFRRKQDTHLESVSLLALLAVALVLSSAWVGTSDTSRGQLAAAIFVFLCFPTFLFLAWLYLVLRGRYENKFESSSSSSSSLASALYSSQMEWSGPGSGYSSQEDNFSSMAELGSGEDSLFGEITRKIALEINNKAGGGGFGVYTVDETALDLTQVNGATTTSLGTSGVRRSNSTMMGSLKTLTGSSSEKRRRNGSIRATRSVASLQGADTDTSAAASSSPSSDNASVSTSSSSSS